MEIALLPYLEQKITLNHYTYTVPHQVFQNIVVQGTFAYFNLYLVTPNLKKVLYKDVQKHQNDKVHFALIWTEKIFNLSLIKYYSRLLKFYQIRKGKTITINKLKNSQN